MPRRSDTDRPRRSRALVLFGCLGPLVIGATLGRSLPRGDEPIVASPPAPPMVAAAPRTAARSPAAVQGFARTVDGAAAAAGSYLVALGGEAILDRPRLEATINRIAASDARQELSSAYATVAGDLRRRFGLDGQPKPVVILRSVPLGYRIDSFTADRALVSIWDLGVVGSGASVDPQASWRTQTITLVWEDGTWKASEFKSVDGPIPALAGRDQPSPPADLFSIVPSLTEYTRVAP